MAEHSISHQDAAEPSTGSGSRVLIRHPRVAFLPDTFHEVNGVAHTSRQLESFARRQGIPFLSIHAGPKTEQRSEGSTRVLELRRGPLAFGLDANLECDPLLFRYVGLVSRTVRDFDADVVHITGPGDMGCLGVYVAWRLQIPLVISWHTSLDEYAALRIGKLLRRAGNRIRSHAERLAYRICRRILIWFYKKGRVLFAPNEEIRKALLLAADRPVYLMSRGVNTELFSPRKRNRTDTAFRIGYVGRFTAEKNVRLLAKLSKAIVDAGYSNFEFHLIGQGSEADWLRVHVSHAVLPGVLRGEKLAEAYANLDLFVFPSKTDTFGNVVLEALSAGVPAIVTSDGGPKFIVEHRVTGWVAPTDEELIAYVLAVLASPQLLEPMREKAREYALRQSWDAVFESVFSAYERGASTSSRASTWARVS